MRGIIVLYTFAAVQILGGAIAFFSAPPEANAATALIIPGAMATVTALLATVALALRKGKPRVAGHVVHGAYAFVLLCALAYGNVAFSNWGGDRQYVATITAGLCAAALVTIVVGVLVRPKSSKEAPSA